MPTASTIELSTITHDEQQQLLDSPTSRGDPKARMMSEDRRTDDEGMTIMDKGTDAAAANVHDVRRRSYVTKKTVAGCAILLVVIAAAIAVITVLVSRHRQSKTTSSASSSLFLAPNVPTVLTDTPRISPKTSPPLASGPSAAMNTTAPSAIIVTVQPKPSSSRPSTSFNNNSTKIVTTITPSALRPPSASPSATPTEIRVITLQPSHAIMTTSPFPTAETAPPTTSARLEMFRTLFLNQSISSADDLYNTTSPQYQALNWLANEDYAELNVTDDIEAALDRYILATFFFATNGSGWFLFNQDFFLSYHNVCEWHLGLGGHGVFCDPLRLELPLNRLAGTIPMEMGRLTKLKKLSLGFNSLSGTIPSELGRLTMLTTFELYGNNLEGTVPTELLRLTMLAEMSLCTNLRLLGTIPTKLGTLTMLTYLSLCWNAMVGTIPTELGKLTMLNVLDLSTNALTGTIPTELGKLTMLNYLYLDNNALTGTIPTELGKLNVLKILNLENNALSGTVPSVLATLPQLENLYVYGNKNISG